MDNDKVPFWFNVGYRDNPTSVALFPVLDTSYSELIRPDYEIPGALSAIVGEPRRLGGVIHLHFAPCYPLSAFWGRLPLSALADWLLTWPAAWPLLAPALLSQPAGAWRKDP